MNTKEAIQRIKDTNIIGCDYGNSKDNKRGGWAFDYIYNDKSGEVIELLKRGEKYEKMWRRLKCIGKK